MSLNRIQLNPTDFLFVPLLEASYEPYTLHLISENVQYLHHTHGNMECQN